jgi:hypothetical protein
LRRPYAGLPSRDTSPSSFTKVLWAQASNEVEMPSSLRGPPVKVIKTQSN